MFIIPIFLKVSLIIRKKIKDFFYLLRYIIVQYFLKIKIKRIIIIISDYNFFLRHKLNFRKNYNKTSFFIQKFII